MTISARNITIDPEINYLNPERGRKHKVSKRINIARNRN